MQKITYLIEKIDEGINNLENRTNFHVLDYKDLLPFIKSNLANFKKSNNFDYIKGLIDEFHKTAIASREGTNAYNNNIWDANIDVQGKSTTLEELFHDLERMYEKNFE